MIENHLNLASIVNIYTGLIQAVMGDKYVGGG